MCAVSHPYLQLNIYDATLGDIQDKLGVLDILSNSGFHFVVLEFPFVSDIKYSPKDWNDQSKVDRGTMDLSSHGEQDDIAVPCNALSAEIDSVLNRSVHKSCISASSLNGQLNRNNSFDWSNHSSIHVTDDINTSGSSNCALSLFSDIEGCDIYSDSMNVLMNSLEPLFGQRSVENDVSRTDEMNMEIRSLLADLVDAVSLQSSANNTSESAVDIEMNFGTAFNSSFIDSTLDAFNTSRSAMGEPLNSSQNKLYIPDVHDSLILSEPVDVVQSENVATIPTNASSISSTCRDVTNTGMRDCHHVKLSRSIISSYDASMEQRNRNQVCISNGQHITETQQQSSFYDVEDRKCTVITRKKKSSNVCPQSVMVRCMFPGCQSRLALNRRSKSYRPSRALRHAQTHIGNAVWCAHCSFRGFSARSLRSHHGKMHPGLVLNMNPSNEEQCMIFETCFPDLVL